MRKGVEGGGSDWLREGAMDFVEEGGRIEVWGLGDRGIVGGGCLDGFPEGSGLVSGAWGFSESYFGAFQGFCGVPGGLWQLNIGTILQQTRKYLKVRVHPIE